MFKAGDVVKYTNDDTPGNPIGVVTVNSNGACSIEIFGAIDEIAIVLVDFGNPETATTKLRWVYSTDLTHVETKIK